MSGIGLKIKREAQVVPIRDVVGIELGVSSGRGVPAVRLVRKGDQVECLSAGFVKLPAELPQVPDKVVGMVSRPWQLPSLLRAPRVAVALNSEQAFLRRAGDGGESSEEGEGYKQRTVQSVAVEDSPVMIAGVPEFKIHWVLRHFPEGRKPTVCSIQIAVTAALNTFLCHPDFVATGGNGMAIVVFERQTAIAAFKDGELMLYYERPIGFEHVQSAIVAETRLDQSTVAAMIEDNLIDPLPIVQPVLQPLLKQIEYSMDYLQRRYSYVTRNFFINRVQAGNRYWSLAFEHYMQRKLQIVTPFTCMANKRPKSVSDEDEPCFMGAAGAALAVLGDFT